jgi:hypothetical protein
MKVEPIDEHGQPLPLHDVQGNSLAPSVIPVEA